MLPPIGFSATIWQNCQGKIYVGWLAGQAKYCRQKLYEKAKIESFGVPYFNEMYLKVPSAKLVIKIVKKRIELEV